MDISLFLSTRFIFFIDKGWKRFPFFLLFNLASSSVRNRSPPVCEIAAIISDLVNFVKQRGRGGEGWKIVP